MLTAILAVLVVVLLIAAGVFALLWRAARREVGDLGELLEATCAEVDSCRAELDALSIAGPPRFDPIHGSHDELPIRDDIRATLTAYCEGMWQHTQPATTEES